MRTLEAIQDFNRIIGFRNVIIHSYDMIDTEIVWDAVKDNVLKLKSDVETLLK
ncbi:MAG: HepT-like ribonuclease domain-containing protein [SAR324 cluster bacterium]|nr:HepT-like ribonuclease domain-containing protein [SAR324 cluster bacterium]